ncbi:MAG: DUF4369 domain-containing protein [Bacteroidales bacterium]|nr:DUF4369 domain-containing protein [Bacteroidales bacterium]
MRKRLWGAAAVLLGLTACHNESFTLEGTIEGGAGKSLYLEEMTPAGSAFADSIAVDAGGHFKYKHPLPYQSLYSLHTSAENYIVLLPDEGETIVVEGDWANLSMTYTVSGSEGSQLLWELQQQSNASEGVVMQLVDTTERYARLLQEGVVSEATVRDKKQTTDSIFRQTRQEFRDYVCRFLEDNQGSIATLIALYKPFNSRPLIDSRDSACAVWYQLVAEGLEREHPNNPHTLHFSAVANQVVEAYAPHDK